MQSFVLALVLVLAVGTSHAVEGEPDAPAAPAAAADVAVEGGASTDAAPPEPADAAPEPTDAATETVDAATQPAEAATQPADAATQPADAGPQTAGDAVEPAVAEAPAPEAADLAEAPAEGPEAPMPAPAAVDPPTVEEAAAPSPEPAPAFDPDGTIHVVRKGDTLWDISNLYLGTPWIWPSLWRDNDDIADPHLIRPGDKIWVSATEMRKVSDAEAAALRRAAEQAAADAVPAVPGPVPAAPSEDAPVTPAEAPTREVLEYWRMGEVGIVAEDDLEAWGRVVGTPEEQVLLTQGDVVFVDRGEGELEPGDRFTLVRTGDKVYDPSSHRVLGVHSEVVGWLEIVRVHGPSARARIRQAYVDFVPGVYLQPREEEPSLEVELHDSPPGVEGQIADLLVDPKYHGGGDVVVLNRGAEHGLEPGSPLEVYRPVDRHWKETWYGKRPDVEIPHEVVADLVVLSVEPHTAMAYVREATTEIWYGDHFRTVGGPSVDLDDLDDRPWTRAMKRLARGVPTPDVDVPDAVSDWNLPRLPLPDLDGYDPR